MVRFFIYFEIFFLDFVVYLRFLGVHIFMLEKSSFLSFVSLYIDHVTFGGIPFIYNVIMVFLVFKKLLCFK